MDKIKMSDIRAKFPMYGDLSDEDLAIAVRKRFYPDIPSAQFYNSIDYDTQRRDPTEGMSKREKVLANIGAGMSNLAVGAKQLYTDLTGTNEEKAALKQQVAEKRALDDRLAKSTDTGKLPDFMPTFGEALQVGGAVAPTMAIPVGSAVSLLRMLPNAARAITGRAAVAAPARVGMGALAGDAAIMGAGYGAITPVAEGESRGMNMLTQSAMSAATPLAIAGGNQVRRMVTNAGGAERAGEQIVGDLAREGANRSEVLRQTLANLRGAQQTAPGTSIPLSTAATLRDPQLARLEAGSRARNGANWYDFDQAQAQAVANDVLRATRGAEDVAQRRTLRGRNWDTRWAQAEGSANLARFGDDLGQFKANIDQAMLSPEASNPAVRSMLQAISDEIERVGPDFSLGHLQQIRANLSGKQKAIPQNAYQGAPRESPATQNVLRQVDEILNGATNGRWQDVVSGYARDSAALDAAKAAGRVREVFIDPATGRVRGVAADAAGDVPKITEAGMGRALDVARGPAKTLALDPAANARLESVLAALRAQNIVQGVKRSATAGGGSNTASDLMAAKAASAAGNAIGGDIGGAVAKGALDKVLDIANSKRDAALARALQNPAELISILEQQVKSGQPLTPLQEQLLAALRGTPAAAAATID